MTDNKASIDEKPQEATKPDLAPSDKVQDSEKELSQDGASDKAKSNEEEVTEEYATGLRLVPVIVAIVLGVFLVALDQVSHQSS